MEESNEIIILRAGRTFRARAWQNENGDWSASVAELMASGASADWPDDGTLCSSALEALVRAAATIIEHAMSGEGAA